MRIGTLTLLHSPQSTGRSISLYPTLEGYLLNKRRRTSGHSWITLGSPQSQSAEDQATPASKYQLPGPTITFLKLTCTGHAKVDTDHKSRRPGLHADKWARSKIGASIKSS